jgi:CRP-like cAMP-binding protein
LRDAGLFDGLSAGGVDVLTREIEIVDAPRGAVLCREGEPGDSLYFVLSGKVKLAIAGPNSRQMLVAVLGPGEQFGEPSLFDWAGGTASPIAVLDARLARLHQSALLRWVQERPQVATQLLRLLAHRVRRTQRCVEDKIFLDAPARVAKQLLQFARAYGSVESGHLLVRHDLSQMELAPAHRRLPGNGEQGPVRFRSTRLDTT